LNAEEIKAFAIASLDDMKGQDISCLEVAGITTIADYMIVVTGTSTRHVKSLSDKLEKDFKDAGGTLVGVEGQKQAEWILIDLGDVIVHVMQDETRKLYDLESLWGMTPASSGY